MGTTIDISRRISFLAVALGPYDEEQRLIVLRHVGRALKEKFGPHLRMLIGTGMPVLGPREEVPADVYERGNPQEIHMAEITTFTDSSGELGVCVLLADPEAVKAIIASELPPIGGVPRGGRIFVSDEKDVPDDCFYFHIQSLYEAARNRILLQELGIPEQEFADVDAQTRTHLDPFAVIATEGWNVAPLDTLLAALHPRVGTVQVIDSGERHFISQEEMELLASDAPPNEM